MTSALITYSPNGQYAPTFDPAQWQADAAQLIGALPEDLRGPVDRAIGAALGGLLRDDKPAQIIHWAREARQPLPPVNWLIDGLLVAGSIVLFAGDGGTGKTYAALDLAVRLASGAADWLGFTLSPCTVLIVDEESGHNRLMRRLRQVMDGNSAPDDISLAFITMQGIQLLEPLGQATLESAIEEAGAGFVVLDAWIDMIAGANDDRASEIQPAYHFLRTLAERHGCTFLIIDHTNKGGGFRGSGAKKGAVDLMLVAERAGDVLTFKTEKARDIEPVTLAARMNFAPGTFNLSPTDAPANIPHFSKGEAFVLRYLAAHGGRAALSEIAAHADTVSDKTAQNAARGLAARGYTQRVDAGGKGDRAIYALTARGLELNAQVS